MGSNKRLPHLILILTIAAAAASALSPAAGRAEGTGGPVSALAVDPNHPQVVLSALPEGLYQSTDGGKTQTALAQAPAGILSLAFDPRDSAIIYAGTYGGGVYRGSSSGAVWEPSGLAGRNIAALAADPLSPGVLYAGTIGQWAGVYRSADGGKTWTRADKGLPPRAGVRVLQFDPQDRRTLYAGLAAAPAGCTYATVYRSTDAGQTWTSAGAGLPRHAAVLDLVIDPSPPATLYVAVEGGALRSTDGAHTWTDLPTPYPGAAITALATDPAVRGAVYAATDHGLWLSADAGDSWKPVAGSDGEEISRLLLGPSPDRPLYSGTRNGQVVRRAGLPAPAVAGVPVAPASPGAPRPPRPSDPVAAPSETRPDAMYIAETRHNLAGGFLAFWKQRGGVEVFGFPITEEFVEDGITVQYFERARFEYRPDLASVGREVQLGLLGRLRTQGRYFVNVGYFPTTVDRVFFPETSHGVGGGFLNFWRSRGGEAIFGLPISEEMSENGRTVQYFERARLEYNPDQRGTAREVTLGLLGLELLRQRGWIQ